MHPRWQIHRLEPYELVHTLQQFSPCNHDGIIRGSSRIALKLRSWTSTLLHITNIHNYTHFGSSFFSSSMKLIGVDFCNLSQISFLSHGGHHRNFWMATFWPPGNCSPPRTLLYSSSWLLSTCTFVDCAVECVCVGISILWFLDCDDILWLKTYQEIASKISSQQATWLTVEGLVVSFAIGHTCSSWTSWISKLISICQRYVYFVWKGVVLRSDFSPYGTQLHTNTMHQLLHKGMAPGSKPCVSNHGSYIHSTKQKNVSGECTLDSFWSRPPCLGEGHQKEFIEDVFDW